MAFSEAYRKQAALLMRVIPLIEKEECFALKGGTAINLFIRDMPRLSVDIDLVYLPIRPRSESLAEIDKAMRRIAARALADLEDAHVSEARTEGTVTKLLITSRGVQIKIEVTPVLRGTIHEPSLLRVSKKVEDAFGFAEMKVASFADLYGGKIVAALDRQHPRDLFDVRDLLANEGIDDTLRQAFAVYLISHNRPMSEVLAPRRKDISQEYRRGFEGMTETSVSLEHLTDARETLIADIVGKMPGDHRRFLVSFEKGEPDWKLLKVDGAANLPAVKWRQQNLDGLSAKDRAILVSNLEAALKVDRWQGPRTPSG